ncbi:MAG TPA: hypothetical protein DDW49_08440 [Deltaproteobacteria bacterium]|nr:MAG: hypothetical protein A2048_05400 [Deltaproteobacteria bacterium GWA2_45_12]HBF13393.1 hypothetical protein [Deltaproteobacteria bacterium]
MTKEVTRDFPKYIRSLREKLGMSYSDVERKSKELDPHVKEYQITDAYVAMLENGKTRPSASKIKALAKIYGENAGDMLYEAGYIDEKPSSGLKDWSTGTLRDHYLASLASRQGTRTLSEQEKRAIEQAVSQLVASLPSEHEKSGKPSNVTLTILRNLYLDALALSKSQKSLREEQKRSLERIIMEYINAVVEKEPN